LVAASIPNAARLQAKWPECAVPRFLETRGPHVASSL
jgi:hypothetical protein